MPFTVFGSGSGEQVVRQQLSFKKACETSQKKIVRVMTLLLTLHYLIFQRFCGLLRFTKSTESRALHWACSAQVGYDHYKQGLLAQAQKDWIEASEQLDDLSKSFYLSESVFWFVWWKMCIKDSSKWSSPTLLQGASAPMFEWNTDIILMKKVFSLTQYYKLLT